MLLKFTVSTFKVENSYNSISPSNESLLPEYSFQLES